MNDLAFVRYIRDLGVELWLDGPAVRYRAPRGALTPDLLAALRSRKEALRGILSATVETAGEPPLRRAARDADPPLSFAQERLWFLEELEPGTAAYAVPLLLRLRGALDTGALRRAFERVIARHEILRTTFDEAGGVARQRVHPPGAFDLPVSVAPDGAAALDVVRAEAARPFDLRCGPLVRARLIEIDADHHLLFVGLHHIVCDGWSLGILVRETAAAYAGAALPELALQYADYAAWQRERLNDERIAPGLAYWREQLAGLSPLELPADRPRPATQHHTGATVDLALPGALIGALRGLAQAEGATLYMVLLAGLQALLGRAAGQDDVAVLSPIAGRTHPGLEPLIGFFVNTLVLRGRLDGDPSFRALIGRARRAALDAYAHQEVPFERLVDELAPTRDPSRAPLAQVLFALHNTPAEPLRSPALQIDELPLSTGVTKFDLHLSLREEAGALSGTCEYSADLFDRATIDELLARFRCLLEGATARPDAPLSAISLLTADEQRQLVAWNDTRAVIPEALLHEQVAAQIARRPEAVAIRWGDQRLTYRELGARAARVRGWLERHEVERGELVGLSGERTPDLVAALLGTLAAGAAYVPLDPSHPIRRLRAIRDDARLRLVVDGRDHRREGDDAIAARPTRARVGGDDLAYAIYTSGSSGRPKGVQISHRALANFLASMQRALGAHEGDRVLALTNVSFDIAGLELLLPLAVGAELELVDRSLAIDGAALAAHLDRVRPTIIQATPITWRLLVEAGWRSEDPRLRALCGGEALPRELAEAVCARVPALWNVYGPTETTIWSTCQRVTATDRAVPIGGPIANTQVHVLERSFGLAPPGMAGELAIGGAGVARGYLGRPGLTAERFMPDPFGPPGARLYLTGDLVRRQRDGALLYLGRIDQQVKLRGHRIELGEIEAQLAARPGIASAVVALRDDGDEPRLVAYLVGRDGPADDADGLRAYLKARLPEPMVPSAFVWLPALPVTPSGKIDRRALPAPDPAASASADGQGPRTTDEQILCDLIAEVLGRERVGIHDDFFALGGHSLLATQLLSRVRHTLEVELPLRAVFGAPTAAALAGQVAAARGGERPRLPAITRAPEAERGPLSHAQRRLWFLSQLEPDGATYNLPSALRLSGPLDAAALGAALAEVVRRHEVLRTSFVEVDGAPTQIVLPAGKYSGLGEIDLTDLPAAERAAEVDRLIAAEVARPFDLASGAPLRAWLVRLADDQHVLLVTVHHIAADGWSLGILVREVVALYRAFAAGRPSPLPALTVQVADVAAWQRRWLAESDEFARQLAYWREHLVDPPVLTLPTDRPRPERPSSRGAEHPIELSAALTRAVERLGRRYGTTLFMTLLAAFEALLCRHAGQDEVLIGTPIANRTRAEVEPLIGFFVNMLVMRGDLRDDPAFEALLGRVKRDALAAYAHQDLPFEKLVEAVATGRDLDRSPLFQVMFALQNTPTEAAEVAGLTIEPVRVSSAVSKFDLVLNLEKRGGRLVGAFEYRTELFDAGTIARLAGHFEALLAGAARAPERRVSELEIVTPDERDELTAWNTTGDGGPDACIDELVAAQAARTPDADAIMWRGRRVSYRDLERGAARVARRLRRAGVGPGDLVGVHLERDPGLVEVWLGVLKAGAAFLPLDPAYPADRLRWMLEDARLSLLVSDAAGAALAGDTPVLPAERLFEGPLAGEGEGESEGEPPAPIRQTSAARAYVLYTSGSTGRPKGVEVHHRAFVNLLGALCRLVGAEPGDRMVALASPSFDLAVLEVFMPLAAGARLDLLDRSLATDGRALAELLERERPTVVHLTPSTWRMLIEHGWRGHAGLKALCGGEAMPRDLAPLLAARAGGGLWNLYGPTETAVCTSGHEVTRFDRPVPIGRPFDNTRLHVLDRAGQPCPPGVVGELYVGGEGVGLGYLRRPALTAERFVPDPWGLRPGARLYRTGDLARRRGDGELEYVGRNDQQIKLRGQRIELGEIEARLGERAEIAAAAVALCQGGGDARLVAYVVVRDGSPLDAARLREHLRARLPAAMVPSAFVRLDALPVTPNGKLDRAALPAPGPLAPAEANALAPRSRLELELVELWESLLDARPIGVRSDFFQLGGHSLLAVRLAAQIERRFGRRLTMVDLFRGPTIEAIAERLAGAEGDRPGREQSPLVPLRVGGAAPALVCVHAIGGSALSYRELAVALGPEQPVYALQARGLDDGAAPSRDVGEMARRYLEALDAASLGAPIWLAGWSFGALVAHEMARALEGAGRAPAGLILVDPPAAIALPDGLADADERQLATLALVARELGLGDEAWNEARRLPPGEQLDRLAALAERAGLLPPGMAAGHLRRTVELHRAHRAAYADHRPSRFGGRALVIRASQQPPEARSLLALDPTAGWGGVLGALETYELDGDHYSLLRTPRVAALAALIVQAQGQPEAQPAAQPEAPPEAQPEAQTQDQGPAEAGQ